MKTKIAVALFAVVLAGGLVASAQSPNANSRGKECKRGAVFTVLPNGVDDTANLQQAFDNAVAAGRGATVRLIAGTYHTRQIVATNFQGAFRGAGAEQTVLTNLPNLPVLPNFNFSNPPSAANPWPVLVAFVGGDFQVSDLGIRITGATPTTGWSVPGAPTTQELSGGLYVLGTRANAILSRICVEGEPAQNTYYGYNLTNGIYFEGCIGEWPWAPISGSFIVRDSTFRHMGCGAPTFNVSDAFILISCNHFIDNGYDSSEGFGLLNSTFEYSFNTVEGGFYGLDIVDAPDVVAQVSQTTSSRLLIRNNVFNGCQDGLFIDTTFVSDSECLVVGNDFRQVADTGIYLGAGTSDCVVKGNTPTTIVNLGTDNVIENGGHGRR